MKRRSFSNIIFAPDSTFLFRHPSLVRHWHNRWPLFRLDGPDWPKNHLRRSDRVQRSPEWFIKRPVTNRWPCFGRSRTTVGPKVASRDNQSAFVFPSAFSFFLLLLSGRFLWRRSSRRVGFFLWPLEKKKLGQFISDGHRGRHSENKSKKKNKEKRKGEKERGKAKTRENANKMDKCRAT